MSQQMTEKEYVPFGTEIYVSNLEQSVKFYHDVLGFTIIREDKEHNFVSFEFNGSVFMMEQMTLEGKRGVGVLFRLLITDLENYYSKVQTAGANITKPLEKKFYGLTRFCVEDPDGYQLKFCSK
jgi:lactoylglutathione lyase